jgi:ArsR family transcriptional regulator, arsenate/arsenite/antimonite-responsive transcriptional repressor
MIPVATREASRAVKLFHALSDETRLEIMSHLQKGEQCVCDLMDTLKSAQSRLSFHLKVLKEAGLIEDRREGRWVYYSINLDALKELEELVRALKQSAKSAVSAGRCC